MARRRLAETFGVASLDAFGSFTDAEAIAALLAVDYVRATQAGTLPRLARPAPQGRTGLLAMDAATRASLEIHRARDGGALHTLFGTVQRTLTPAGARLLAGWLAAPLTDPAAIAARQDAWAWLVAEREAAGRLRAALRTAPDIARALGRLSVGRGGPRDLAALRDGLRAARAARRGGAGERRLRRVRRWPAGGVGGGGRGRHAPSPNPLPQGERAVHPVCPDVLAPPAAAPRHARPHRSNRRWPPPSPTPRRTAWRTATPSVPGFDAELDAERALRDDSRRVLATLQLDYAQRYGVASLKIRHHAQLGYVIEAPAAAVEKLRDFPELTLRQGMANGARFTTPELSDLDRRISEAGERAAARERAVFAHLVQTALAHADALAACADALALLDAAQSAAKLAEAGTWCRPAGDRRRCVPGPMPAAIRWWKPRSPATRSSCRTTATCRPTSACCCSPAPTWPANRRSCARTR